MDTLTIAAYGAAGFFFLLFVLFWRRSRRARQAMEAAAKRIGARRTSKRSRPADDLTAGLDQIDGYIAHAQRDRAQLLSALESAELGIMAVADSGVVTFVNAAGQRYLGARHGEAVAEVRLKEVLEDVIVNRVPATQELDLYTPVRRVLRMRAVPIDHGVESLGAVLYIEDMTEQRRVDAVRRDFVANVGHELKTPLGALSILAETLSDTEDPDVRRKLAERLSVESNRMADLVNDLLDLSEVEAFGAPAEPVPVSVIVTDAVGTIRLVAEDRGVEVVVQPVPEDAAVVGERRQLVSAVSNLLDNAIKYSDKQDETSKVWLRVSQDEQWVSIEVQDEGIGIPRAHLDRVFERFYRVDKGRDRASGGTGLGLSIVRHVALNTSGEVAVTSEEGKGSTFTLRLPRWVP